MKVLYIAGPYGDAPEINTGIASILAFGAWRRGWATICPHKNTFGFEERIAADDPLWYNGYIEIVRRCDAVLMMPDWHTSRGATAEREEAIGRGIPVFEYDIHGIPLPDEVPA